MTGFIVRRLALGVLVLAALSCGSFCLFSSVREGWHPHPSLLSQWWTWTKGLFGGDTLHVFSAPTVTRNFTLSQVTMVDALGHTAVLIGLTLVVVVALAVGLALVAAAYRGSAFDAVLRSLSYLAWALPAFLLGLLIQYLVDSIGSDHGFGPFPVAGWAGTCPAGIGVNHGTLTPCPAAGSGLHYVLNVLRYAALPTLTLAVGFVGLHTRYLRSALLDTLKAPFVVVARGKGLRESRVLVRHALRASLGTFVGALLSDFGAVLGAALAVDYVFQFNGLGSVFIGEIPTQDGATVDPSSMTALLMLTALFVILSSIFADLAVIRLDPRIRGGD